MFARLTQIDLVFSYFRLPSLSHENRCLAAHSMSWRKPAAKRQINLGVKWSHAVECRSDVGDEAFLVWHYRLVTGFEHGPPEASFIHHQRSGIDRRTRRIIRDLQTPESVAPQQLAIINGNVHKPPFAKAATTWYQATVDSRPGSGPNLNSRPVTCNGSTRT